MKKIISLLVLLAVLAGACFTAAAEDSVTLWLVTEESTAEGMNAITANLIAQFQDAHPGVSIRMDILPNAKADRESYLASLREQLAAGSGPDLFLLTTDKVLTLDSPKKYTYRSITHLFPDVTAAMEDGAFADLSVYYDSDDTLEKGSLNQAVMDGGVLGEARYVLPLRYNIPVIYAVDDMLESAGIAPETLNGNLNEIMEAAISQRNVPLAQCVDTTSASVFANLSASDEDALTIQEVSDYFQNVQDLKALLGTDSGHIASLNFFLLEEGGQSLTTVKRNALSNALNFLAAEAYTGSSISMYPARSTSGKIVANVTYYGAVSSCCGQPELAYEFLRLFLSEGAQWEGWHNIADNDWPLAPSGSGWPVLTKGSVQALWENAKQGLDSDALGEVNLDDGDLPILDTQIDVVQFPVVTELASFLSQLNDYDNGNAPTNADIPALAEAFISSLR